MATTTNFGWPTPDDTDLVKNGAAAMRSLGSGIDTSLVKLKGGTTGQILSKASNTDLDYVWIANDQGDITAVTAGTGITGGGTSGAVTITNEMATTIDAKGDLIVGTADNTFARLGVGSNDQVLTADSTTATGLKWATSSVATSLGFTAGKNAIINGDFSVNQRNFSSTTSVGFGFDRWAYDAAGGTVTYSAQTFTAGTAPVTGYESKNFARLVTASQSATSNYAYLYQRIEDVRVLANQTAVISFWAKANTGTPKIAVEIEQVFGTGGSPSTRVRTYFGQATLSTSWARYTLTTTIPSISGKTLGTNNDSYLEVNLFTSAGSDFNSRTGSLGLQNFTADIWGVQVEAGSTATSFQTATGTIQGELAACQRYYQRVTSIGANTLYVGTGVATSTTRTFLTYSSPVSFRTTPSVAQSNASVGNTVISAAAVTSISVYNTGSYQQISLDVSVGSGLTASGAFMFALPQNAYVELSSEL